MVALIARYKVKPNETQQVIQLLQQMQAKIKEFEPACQIFRVHRPTDHSDVLVLYEVYTDIEAMEAHRGTDHYRNIIEGQVAPLLEGREREVLDLVID
ncbi:putative quinol monooxygenase [Paenibacillus xerothermodurans]|uniref:Antibiotic biosynthesis monooxygenase n=1 Tax=Paenibacillus xerothermodurans TaxID=1977292 RepID=A0A2W1N8X4_PAEXE|nr:putative quinol monooxygenase [Paenibacillus xerothermodurans]PZE21079.1 antibiotic biosynthesis monooxygenase [Paenibacillus xerothermodurans]